MIVFSMATPRQTRASKLNAQTPTSVRQIKQQPIVKKMTEKLTPPEFPIVKEINSDGTIVWNEDTEPILFRNVLKLKPVGPMKHWRMMLVRKRVSQALDYPVSSHAIWNHLSTLFDLKALDEMETADKEDKVEAFSLPKSFSHLKQQKLTDGTPGKETRLRKTSSSLALKGGSDIEDDSLPGKIDDEESNPDSPSALLSEDGGLIKKSGGKTSVKRVKSAEISKKPKIPSDRPGTPVEASKRSRTPLGTKRPRRSSDMEDDDEIDTSEGRDTPASPALFLEEEVNSTSSSSRGEDVKKSAEVKSSQGTKKIEGKSSSGKKLEGKPSGKKHNDSKSSSDRRTSESKTPSSSKKSHDSKTPSSGKKTSDKLHGSLTKSSEHKSSKHSDSHRSSSSGNKHSSSKTPVSGRKEEDVQQASRSSDTESTSSNKRGSSTKPAGTPKRPRTPSGSSKKQSSGSSSKKHNSDASSKKNIDSKVSRKLTDDAKTADDTQYSSSSELGRDSPSSVRESTDTPTSTTSTSENAKTPAKAKKRSTLSESDTSDSKSVSKESKTPGKRISLQGKKPRRVKD